MLKADGICSFDRINKQFKRACSSVCDKKVKTKVVVPKRVLSSKNVHSSAHLHGKSRSADVITNNKAYSTRIYKKTTKSDVSFNKNETANPVDYCRKCGDGLPKHKRNNNNIQTNVTLKQTSECAPKPAKYNNKCNRNPHNLQQYYKNENFQLSTESVITGDNYKKITSLKTIEEVSEIRTPDISESKVYAETKTCCLDNISDIKQLKEFRSKNYFECHSANSRIEKKPSVTCLEDHKCVYRFYLNERLFPVPLNADFSNQIRCLECHLPMDPKNNENGKINGTIQAKVRLGDEVKDLMLLLPVKEPLIIREKRTEAKVETEEVYFGVIKLSPSGQSIFNNSVFDESLALRYQKGFKQLNNCNANYKPLEENDLIFI